MIRIVWAAGQGHALVWNAEIGGAFCFPSSLWVVRLLTSFPAASEAGKGAGEEGSRW